VPFADPTAYVAAGVSDNRCGAPILFSAAQRLSEVHVVTGAVYDGLNLAAGVTGLNDRVAGNLLARLGSDQFNEDALLDMIGGDEMTSSGGVDVVAHPAKKNAAMNRIAGDLDTQPLCGWGNRTQAVSTCRWRSAVCPKPQHSRMRTGVGDFRNRLPRTHPLRVGTTRAPPPGSVLMARDLSLPFDSVIICQRQTLLLENTRCHYRGQRRALRAAVAR